MARKSRLTRNFQKKSRNTFIFSVIGIIIILFLLFRYGIPFLSDASFLFGRATSTPESTQKEDIKESFVPTPRLDPIPSATNEKGLIVEGSTLAGLEVEIYLNGESIDKVETDESGNFESEIKLTDGDNIIKARSVKNDATGEFTSSKSIVYIESGPELKIDFPSNDFEIKDDNPIEIKGSTDTGSSVTVNDFQAIIKSDGNWSYFLTLTNGDNDIKVISIDAAGNETKEVIRVKYSP